MSRNQFSTGHVASPYMRRFRLPMLNTYRSFDESTSPSEDIAKWELITARMNETTKDATGNASACSLLTNTLHDDKPNEKRKSEAKLKASISDPFFHPRLLFSGSKL